MTSAVKVSTSKKITPRKLLAEYDLLCQKYLPITSDDIWRFSLEKSSDIPNQGWKLHIPATIFSATIILEKVAPFLESQKALFKAPQSLIELGKINSGMFYGYSQIGKFITVYPQSENEFIYLAKKLHTLTYEITAPFIPFDLRYSDDSNIYYRYGAFKHFEIKNSDGISTPAIFDLKGNLVPDLRDNEKGKPDWISNPLDVIKKPPQSISKIKNPLQTTYKVFNVLSQRGKGGVYIAIDLRSQPPQLSVIKEGRRNGELNWIGRDGYDYVKKEAQILDELSSIEIGLPQKYDTFELDNNFYLVTEFIDGENLQKLLIKRKHRLSIKKALHYSYKIASHIAKLHSVNWVWHDCKPGNIIITKDDNLRFVDFEGACKQNETVHFVWGTDDFLPPECKSGFKGKANIPVDLFALGAVIYYLLGGRFYSNENPVPLQKLRRNISSRVKEIVAALLDKNPKKRPSAKVITQILQNELNLLD